MNTSQLAVVIVMKPTIRGLNTINYVKSIGLDIGERYWFDFDAI
jgi:hypothetical protein